MGIDFTKFYIYRWRYIIGYSLIGLSLIVLLTFAGLFEPGGISSAEQASVIKSSGISITDISSLAVTNLPFHLLQHASLSFFGISEFSIKLPSLIFAFLSAIGLFALLRMWFKANIAVLTTLIAISTGQFLFIAQSGTPDIQYVLWPVWLLVLGTMIAKRIGSRLLIKTLFFIVAGLSLYTPLSIYALIALGAATLLHPHLRFIIRSLSKPQVALGAILALLIVTPLVLGVIKSQEFGLLLLGVPMLWPDLISNVTQLSAQYFGFWIGSSTGLMTPVFSLGSMIIIALGAYRLVRTRESTQSYLIILWLVSLIPALLINPLYSSITFLPFVLLMATGLGSLLSYWYRLFPRNPYARIAGLIPLIVLIVTLSLSGFDRYVYGYRYDPRTVPNFSQDLALLPKTTKNLLVSPGEYSFYKTVAHYNKDMVVTLQPTGLRFIATNNAAKDYSGYKIDRIIVSTAANDADRFYIYKKSDL